MRQRRCVCCLAGWRAKEEDTVRVSLIVEVQSKTRGRPFYLWVVGCNTILCWNPRDARWERRTSKEELAELNMHSHYAENKSAVGARSRKKEINRAGSWLALHLCSRAVFKHHWALEPWTELRSNYLFCTLTNGNFMSRNIWRSFAKNWQLKGIKSEQPSYQKFSTWSSSDQLFYRFPAIITIIGEYKSLLPLTCPHVIRYWTTELEIECR